MNNCPNCGHNAKNGEVFCKKCGTKLALPENTIQNDTQIQQLNNNNQNENYQQSLNNEELVNSYIGKNADKLKKGGFSINTFFFGIIYVLYRKMWLLGLIWLTIATITSIFLKSLSSIISLVLGIIISIKFKDLYIKHVNEQVNKIKSENKEKSQEELIVLCRKKGGTSLIPVIILVIVYIIIFTFSFLSIYKEMLKNGDIEYNNNAIINTTNSSRIIGSLHAKIPSDLIENKPSSDYYKTYNNSNNKDDYCSLSFLRTNAKYYNNDAKSYLEKNIYYSTNDTYSGIIIKKINGNTWYYATVTNNYRKYYYYTTVNDENIYEVYFYTDNDENNTCSLDRNKVEKSLRFK